MNYSIHSYSFRSDDDIDECLLVKETPNTDMPMRNKAQCFEQQERKNLSIYSLSTNKFNPQMQSSCEKMSTLELISIAGLITL